MNKLVMKSDELTRECFLNILTILRNELFFFFFFRNEHFILCRAFKFIKYFKMKELS